MLTLELGDFRPAFKNQVKFDHPNNKKKQINPYTEINWSSTPRNEVEPIWTTHTKTKSIFMLISNTGDIRTCFK